MEAKGKMVKPDKAAQSARRPEVQGRMSLEEIEAHSKSRDQTLEQMKARFAKLKEQNLVDEWVKKELAIIDMRKKIDKQQEVQEKNAAQKEESGNNTLEKRSGKVAAEKNLVLDKRQEEAIRAEARKQAKLLCEESEREIAEAHKEMKMEEEQEMMATTETTSRTRLEKK